MLVLKRLVGLHRSVHLQLLCVTGWGIDLDYRDVEWFALETNRDHSVFEIALKDCSTLMDTWQPVKVYRLNKDQW